MPGLARMRKLLVLVLFAAACGGGSSSAPATASTTPPTAAASSDVFAVKDMTFFEGNDPVMHVSKDGHIEIQTKHVQNGGPATTDKQFVGVIAADGSVSDPTEIAYYVCYGPRRATLLDLAWTAGSRWHIEECFQQAKNEAGLDDYQVRSYRAWYAHITLSMLALAGLAAIKTHVAKGDQTCAIAT